MKIQKVRDKGKLRELARKNPQILNLKAFKTKDGSYFILNLEYHEAQYSQEEPT